MTGWRGSAMAPHGRHNERLCSRSSNAVEDSNHNLKKVRDSTASNSNRDLHARFEFRRKRLVFQSFPEQGVEFELPRGGIPLVKMKHLRQGQGHGGYDNANFKTLKRLPTANFFAVESPK